jgi:hypothetical protein
MHSRQTSPYYLLTQTITFLAITVPVFDLQDPSKLLTHFIVGAALFMFDNKYGSYINCLGVVDKGTPGVWCSTEAILSNRQPQIYFWILHVFVLLE